MKRIVQFISNDISYDQRLIRKCTSLSTKDFDVVLIGRNLPNSIALTERKYKQERWNLRFNKGSFFYLELNFKIFVYLLKNNFDTVTANDVDTALGCVAASYFKSFALYFDAHELFTEVPELRHSAIKRKAWKIVEYWVVRRAKKRYTVCNSLKKIFEKEYKKPFAVLRNLPFSLTEKSKNNFDKTPKILLYQGAVNDGRCVNTYIDMMEFLPECELHICGEGDLFKTLHQYSEGKKWKNKIVWHGKVSPEKLVPITQSAFLILNALEDLGKNYYYALSNKFLDAIQSGIPSINMNWPEFREIIAKYDVGLLIEEPNKDNILNSIQSIINHKNRYTELHENCIKAAGELNWEVEEEILFNIYK